MHSNFRNWWKCDQVWQEWGPLWQGHHLPVSEGQAGQGYLCAHWEVGRKVSDLIIIQTKLEIPLISGDIIENLHIGPFDIIAKYNVSLKLASAFDQTKEA